MKRPPGAPDSRSLHRPLVSFVRGVLVATIFAVAVASVPRSADALERALARAGDPQSEWNGGADCSIQYWNTCVGWTWTWTGWSPFDRIGVNYTSCAGGFLVGVDIFTRFTNGVPVLPGYGFSPTLLAYAAEPPVSGFAALDRLSGRVPLDGANGRSHRRGGNVLG
jgi:hypothetical protein